MPLVVSPSYDTQRFSWKAPNAKLLRPLHDEAFAECGSGA